MDQPAHPPTERPTGTAPVLEVHLEELGQHSWVAALLTTVSGSHGSAQFRFVARVAGAEDRRSAHVVESATFPVLPAQDLRDDRAPNGWIELAHERLEELDAELVGRGWRRRSTLGPHWWSRTYERGSDRVRGR